MNQIDDYMLNGQAPKKKKGKGILVILFILFFMLVALCGMYWYYLNYMQEMPKSTFFKYVGQNNFSNILNTDIYYTMLEKMSEQGYETETTANFTTTIENDFTKNVDVSKFEVVLNTSLDRENEASLFDAKINYSSNDIFNLKLINTRDSVGIGSDEVLDKYIATSKTEYSNSIKRTTGLETTVSSDIINQQINELSNNRIALSEEYKAQKITEYSELIFNLVPEEAVTKNENIMVTLDSKTINSEAYTLSLDANKYKEILSNVLTNLKNNQELLEKIVTNTEIENEAEIEEKPETVINPLPNVQVEYTGAETEEHQTSTEIEVIQEGEEPEQLEIVKDIPNQNLVKDENIVEENNGLVEHETLEEQEDTINQTKLFENLISAFVFNQKIEGTVEDLIEQIELELANIDSLNEGVKITVYIRNEVEQPKETIKLIAELPNKTSIDVEYQTENKFKITYLEENEDNVTQGTSIEVERTTSDIKTKFDIEVNDIKNTKVVAKTQIEFETEGSKSSKDYANEAIIKYSDNEGDTKINIKNIINFEDIKVEEILNDENAIFVDKLTDEEAATLYTQVYEKIMQVYTEKIENLSFIDNNSAGSLIQQSTHNEEEKSVVRQNLIDKVSNMMREAQENGGELTIQDLENLQIEGLNVSSIITEEQATIKINGYTFYIDKNFVLTE